MKPVVLTTVCLILCSFSEARVARVDEAFLPCPGSEVLDEAFVRNYQLALESRAPVSFDPQVRTTTRTRSNWMHRFSGGAFDWTWTHGFDQKPLTTGQVVVVEKAFYLERDGVHSIAMVLDARTSGGLETFTLDLVTSSKVPLAWFEKRLKLAFLCKKIE